MPDGMESEMSDSIQFFVPGVPAPQGSKKAFYIPKIKRSVLVESSKALRPWRDSVRAAAMAAWGDREHLVGPVYLSVEFRIQRPMSHYRTGKHAGELKESSPVLADKGHDLDKLTRAIGDSLTGVCFRDDKQIAVMSLKKRYAETPGAAITVEPAEGVIAGDTLEND